MLCYRSVIRNLVCAWVMDSSTSGSSAGFSTDPIPETQTAGSEERVELWVFPPRLAAVLGTAGRTEEPFGQPRKLMQPGSDGVPGLLSVCKWVACVSTTAYKQQSIHSSGD